MTESYYVLAIDQAADSGWCVLEAPAQRVLSFGLARNATDRAAAVAEALRLAGDAPLLACMEDHSKMRLSRGGKHDYRSKVRGKRNTATVLGIGDARGRWLERLELVGLPKTRIGHKVDRRVWCKAVVGQAFAEKEDAVRHARAVTGRELDHNIAEAVCIALWAGRNLPAPTKRQRARKTAARVSVREVEG